MQNQRKSKVPQAAEGVRRKRRRTLVGPAKIKHLSPLSSDDNPTVVRMPFSPAVIDSPPALDLTPKLAPTSESTSIESLPPLDLSRSSPPSNEGTLWTLARSDGLRIGMPDMRDGVLETSHLCQRCQRVGFARLRNLLEVTVRRLDKMSINCSACAFFMAWHYLETTSQSSSLPELKRSRVTLSDKYFRNNPQGFKAVFLRLSSRSSNYGRAVLISTSSLSDTQELAGRQVQRIGVNYDLFKSWLNYCDTKHATNCGPKYSFPTGLRVIDCISREILPHSLEDGNASYLTLSYVWGISKVEISSKDIILPATTPKVIDDAMLVVVRLGFRYLWVDRYCILQDDDALKHSQIRNMGKIYAASALTIIAAAGDGPHHGLPGVTSRLRPEQLQVTIGTTTLTRQCQHPGILVQGSKWNTRGWTYQEGLLARRRLVFTDEEVYFQCQSMNCLESISTPLGIYHNSITSHDTISRQPVFPDAVSYESPMELLKRISEYFVRDLTLDCDALEAISGVFDLFRLTKKPIYSMCGLPILNPKSVDDSQKMAGTTQLCIFVLALCWRSDGNLCRRSCFPSWTWAGWKPGDKIAKIDFEVLNMLKKGDGISIPKTFSLPPNTIVTLQNGNGPALDWERDFEKILYRYSTEHYTGSLQVTGWTFTLSLQSRRHSLGQFMTKPDLPFANQVLLNQLGNTVKCLGFDEMEITVLVLFRTLYEPGATRFWAKIQEPANRIYPLNSTAGLLFLVKTNSSALERLTYATVTDLPDLLDVGYQEYAKGLGIEIRYQQVHIT